MSNKKAIKTEFGFYGLKKIVYGLLIIGLVLAVFGMNAGATPVLNFTGQTPGNNTCPPQDWAEINISIVEQNLDTFSFEWNNTNYTIYNDSLVLGMNLDNNSALGENNTHFYDFSNKNNGSCSGVTCPTFTTNGKYGGAFDFDGVNDHVDVGLVISGYPFSLSAWVKADDKSDGAIISFSSGSDTYYHSIVFDEVSGDFIVTARSYDGAINDASSGDIISIGNWYHVVGVWTNDSHREIYLNGISQDSDAGTVSGIGLTNIKIGVTADSTPWGYFNGTIDEVRIYNRALTPDEITMSYRSNLQKYNSTQWYFYTNITNGTYDYSGWANNTGGDSNSTEIRSLCPACTLYYADQDDDSYGNASDSQCLDAPSNPYNTTDHTDCNDSNSNVHPGAVEVCNGIDDDCEGAIDEGSVCLTNYYCDNDNDGYIDASVDGNCNYYNCIPAGCQVAQGNDCNDTNAAINPGATEICNSDVDDDCNALTDESSCSKVVNPPSGVSVVLASNPSVDVTVTEVMGPQDVNIKISGGTGRKICDVQINFSGTNPDFSSLIAESGTSNGRGYAICHFSNPTAAHKVAGAKTLYVPAVPSVRSNTVCLLNDSSPTAQGTSDASASRTDCQAAAGEWITGLTASGNLYTIDASVVQNDALLESTNAGEGSLPAGIPAFTPIGVSILIASTAVLLAVSVRRIKPGT
ncbi:hypothetical protein BEH94_08330 [Candidatus Altiarchaeales archaeon WOR_SM1_SCG]|nr:hypothetical protein BEH94_08330 [Candidatus Altiarchaeales archaeon WOR_SM1_SCG]